MRSYYAPNIEPDVVLECGCVVSGWGQLKVLGEPKYWLSCDRHKEGKGKWGTQQVIREATLYDRFRWYELGISAPKRRPGKTLRDVLTMPGIGEKETRSNSRDSGTLF